jgi:hypothetical protein
MRLHVVPAFALLGALVTQTSTATALTPLELGEISGTLGADLAKYHARRGPAHWLLDNPRHQIRAEAGREGIRFGDALDITLASHGCGNAMRTVVGTEWHAEANRLERSDGALTEWLRNGPEGIQHGFTLASAAQDCADARDLRLRFRVAGNSHSWRDGALHAGNLVYRELYAIDGAGIERSARFVPEVGGFTIVVDVHGVRWPLLIDPFAQSQKLLASDQQSGAELGSSIAASGNTVVVGAPRHDLPGIVDAGAAYVFVRSAGGFAQEAKLVASDAAFDDRFGTSVAIDANTVLVGAPNDDVLNNANQGSAYVFVRSGSNWTQQTKLLVTIGAAANQQFGSAVAVSGNTAVIGAPSANSDRGRADVFVRAGTSWSFQSELASGNSAAGDRFGTSVAVQGDSALVGAPRSDFSGTDLGLAHQFLRSGTLWSEGQLLQINHFPTNVNDNFGLSVAIDGLVALVGAPGVDVNGLDANQQPSLNIDQGIAYAFRRPTLLDDFQFERRLVRTAGRLGDNFGAALAVSNGVSIIGAPRSAVGGAVAEGAAFEFTRNSLGGWSESSLLVAQDGAASFGVGSSVAIANGIAFAGAPAATPAGGAAYVFADPFGVAPSNPDDAADPPPNPSGNPDSQNAGAAVATAQNFMLVGAPEFGDNAASRGRVFLYAVKGQLDPTGCSVNADSDLIATFTNNSGGLNDKFGAAVAMAPDGNSIAIGMPGFNSERGRVVLFRAPPTGWSGTVDVSAVTADSVTPAVAIGTKFGAAVGLSAAGVLIAGAPQDGTGGSGSGFAQTFLPVGGLYPNTATQTLSAPAPQGGAGFGSAVAIDDTRIVVGAPNEDNVLTGGGTAIDAGAAYAFRAPTATGTFAAAGAMEALNGGATGDKFGSAVALARDTMVVGAPFMDGAGGQNSGAAMVFEDQGAAAPTPVAMLEPAPGLGQNAGSSVGIAGEYVLLGSPFTTTIDSLSSEGTSYLFEEPTAGWGSISPPPAQPTKGSMHAIKAIAGVAPATSIAPLKRQGQQRFGAAVALSQLGIAVGAPLRDDPYIECAGPPTSIIDDGGADAYLFLRILRDGFEQ